MSSLFRRSAVGTIALLLNLSTMRGQQSGLRWPLISAQEVQKRLDNPALVLLYVGPKDAYDKEHIPGARYIEVGRDWVLNDPDHKTGLYLPGEAELRARLERLGIGDRSSIVVTAGGDWGSPATRAVWTLQAAGLGEHTRLLDGGTVRWKAAGFPVTAEVPPAPKPAHLSAPADRSIAVGFKWIQDHETSPHVRIIDARSPVFYEGNGAAPSVPPGGHIAGATNLPFDGLFDETVHFLPLPELKRKFDAAGIAPGDTVAAYCHVGQQATAVLFAAELLGHPIRLYEGSMSDWQGRHLPLVKGTSPK